MNPKEYGNRAVKSTNDMWLFDCERIDTILRNCTELRVNLRSNPTLLIAMHDVLTEFYRQIRPLAGRAAKREKDAELAQLKELIFTEYRRSANFHNCGAGNRYLIDEQVISSIDKMYNALMDLRQLAGMGVRGSIEISEGHTIKRAVRGVGK